MTKERSKKSRKRKDLEEIGDALVNLDSLIDRARKDKKRGILGWLNYIEASQSALALIRKIPEGDENKAAYLRIYDSLVAQAEELHKINPLTCERVSTQPIGRYRFRDVPKHTGNGTSYQRSRTRQFSSRPRYSE